MRKGRRELSGINVVGERDRKKKINNLV